MVVSRIEDRPGDEPPGTFVFCSVEKRAYFFFCQTAERMEIERRNARQAGIQDPIDFIFVLDGQRIELTYDQFKARLLEPPHE